MRISKTIYPICTKLTQVVLPTLLYIYTNNLLNPSTFNPPYPHKITKLQTPTLQSHNSKIFNLISTKLTPLIHPSSLYILSKIHPNPPPSTFPIPPFLKSHHLQILSPTPTLQLHNSKIFNLFTTKLTPFIHPTSLYILSKYHPNPPPSTLPIPPSLKSHHLQILFQLTLAQVGLGPCQPWAP